MVNFDPERLQKAGFAIIDQVIEVSKISADRKLYVPKEVDLKPHDKVVWIQIDGMWLLRKTAK